MAFKDGDWEKGFGDITSKEQIKRMSDGELQMRGMKSFGFWGWQLKQLEANLPQIALLVLALIGFGIYELCKYIASFF